MRSLPACLLAALLCNASHAAPFVPRSDTEIVETLPQRIGSAEQRRQQRAARERLRQQPTQLPLALQLAREAIERARRQGDPRELGQAEAALAPWWQASDPPPAVRLLRATVRQSQHDFEAARVDLDALLRHNDTPLALQAQAELTRAAVLQVQGRWQDAQTGCEHLAGDRYAELGDAVQIPAQACLAELASLQGSATQGEERLRALQRRAGASSWLALLRAELAERRGDEAAGTLYRQALDAAGPGADVYTLGAYADWLLARNRDAEVLTLLSGREDADALLLRLAIAQTRTRSPQAAASAATLAARFDAAAQRGDNAHERERARYELDVKGDAAAALVHAEANWRAQKEPADGLLLARSAAAAARPEAAEPLRRLMRETGLQDVRLTPLLDRPAAASPPKSAS